MAKILIVDDSSFQRKRIVAICTSAGYDTAEAATGEEGLELIESESPDLVICDLLMPGIGGIGLLEALEKKDGPPIIILTADIQKSVRDRCFQLGAKAFLNKPPDKDKLITEIGKAVG